MNGLLSLLPAILGPISDILGRLIPDPNKRIELENEITKALLSNQASMLDAMKSVMVADAQSEGWLTRNARPLTVVWGLSMLTWLGVVAPSLGIGSEAIAAIKQVPSDLWNLVTVGVGAYILGKTGESIATSMANRPTK